MYLHSLHSVAAAPRLELPVHLFYSTTNSAHSHISTTFVSIESPGR